MKEHLLVGAAFCALVGACPYDARASEDEPSVVPELVVTARHREEAARDVPFALNVLDQTALRDRRVDDAQSLFRQVPGLA